MSKKWSRKYEKCIRCETTEKPHIADGLCLKCYQHKQYQKNSNIIKHPRGYIDSILTEEKLIELYLNRELSLREIAKEVGCTAQNVLNKLKKYSVKRRTSLVGIEKSLEKGRIKYKTISNEGIVIEHNKQKNHYNRLFFKSWSDEMAYVLGLIYTDGNIKLQKTNSGGESGRLLFAQKEKEVVEKMLNLMDCNAKIIFRNKKVKDGKIISGEVYYFAIGINELYYDLKNLGLSDNKSLTIKFPVVPKQHLRHFIRGLFDGDGSVYFEKKDNRLKIKFVSGSRDFILGLLNALVAEGFPTRNIYGGTGSTPNAFFIRYEANQARNFFEYFYSNTPEYMYWSRKYNILKGHLEAD